MPTNVCIKGIRKSDWRYFKSEAAKADKTMGDFFSSLVLKYKENKEDNWDDILSRSPMLSESDAEEITERARAFRKDFDFR